MKIILAKWEICLLYGKTAELPSRFSLIFRGTINAYLKSLILGIASTLDREDIYFLANYFLKLKRSIEDFHQLTKEKPQALLDLVKS